VVGKKPIFYRGAWAESAKDLGDDIGVPAATVRYYDSKNAVDKLPEVYFKRKALNTKAVWRGRRFKTRNLLAAFLDVPVKVVKQAIEDGTLDLLPESYAHRRRPKRDKPYRIRRTKKESYEKARVEELLMQVADKFAVGREVALHRIKRNVIDGRKM